MPILTIIPERYSTYFRMKGLSIRAAGYAGHDLIKDEGGYCIDNDFKINGKTALISVTALVKYLKELYEELPFESIKIKGHYEATGEQLMKLVISE